MPLSFIAGFIITMRGQPFELDKVNALTGVEVVVYALNYVELVVNAPDGL